MHTRARVLAFIMAGGKGTRLEPLTANRSKPSVPFGGRYRIIDFVLSNMVNSGIYSIYVLTQFKSQSLTEHLLEGWNIGGVLPGQFVMPVPAQQRTGEHWYRGTADAIFQNANLIEDSNPDLVLVFGGDHIFMMNVDHMIQYARTNEAEVTIACIPVPIAEAHEFGVVQVDDDWRIVGFQEKPSNPTPIPGQPDKALVSMGNYLFDPDLLLDSLADDADDAASSHDFGKNVLPKLLADGRKMFAYDFGQNEIPGAADESNPAYWRDVGNLDAYYDATMDLRAVEPELDLYNPQWPIRTAPALMPPPKFVHNVEGRVGQAIQSIVCEGTIISGGSVMDSIIGRGCRINSFAEVNQSILMDDVKVGRGAKLFRCIVDKHVTIPAGDRIGFDPEADRKRFHITERGIVVIPKSSHVELPS
ncbi:MAG: glucose-1-phosphate adenylyltransferase [Planctomycetota bacterium]|jgi:glucose-1-phosphate adenylyltransferase|nr:glucose-1-phosphate adenylyltransferase [Planctomycetota bacterium]